MATARTERVSYDLALMEMDLAAKGWSYSLLAQQIGVSRSRVCRFFSGESQTQKTAKLISKALGKSVRRYLRPVTVSA